jgi:hypothetical protein
MKPYECLKGSPGALGGSPHERRLTVNTKGPRKEDSCKGPSESKPWGFGGFPPRKEGSYDGPRTQVSYDGPGETSPGARGTKVHTKGPLANLSGICTCR